MTEQATDTGLINSQLKKAGVTFVLFLACFLIYTSNSPQLLAYISLGLLGGLGNYFVPRFMNEFGRVVFVFSGIMVYILFPLPEESSFLIHLCGTLSGGFFACFIFLLGELLRIEPGEQPKST